MKKEKKIIIKREDKNDVRKTVQIENKNLLINNNPNKIKNADKNYYLRNSQNINNNIKRKEFNDTKKIPMDGKEEICKY